MERRDAGSSDSAPPEQEPPCRVQLVGMFRMEHDGSSAVVEQHLGPFTLPRQDTTTLLQLGQQLGQFVSIHGPPGQQHFRLEYSCYGHRVPILSDAALKEAFGYFRDQVRQQGPATAATTSTLYLWPTNSAEPWTLTEYLAESQKLQPAHRKATGGSSGAQDREAAGVLRQPQLPLNPEVSPRSSRALDRSNSSGSKGPSAAVAAAAAAGGDAAAQQQKSTLAAAAGDVLFGLTPVEGPFPMAAAESGGSGGGMDSQPTSQTQAAEQQAAAAAAQAVGQGGTPAAAAAAAAAVEDRVCGTSSDASVGVSRSGSMELQALPPAPPPAAAAAAAAAGLTNQHQQQQQQQQDLQQEGLAAVVTLQHPPLHPAAAAAADSPAQAVPTATGVHQQQQQHPPQPPRASHKRHAADSAAAVLGDGRGLSHAPRQQQQQQLLLRISMGPNGPAATATLSSGLSDTGTLSPTWSAGSSRAESAAAAAAAAMAAAVGGEGSSHLSSGSNKAARRGTAHSPRSTLPPDQQPQQQQQQQRLSAGWEQLLQQQQQQQQVSAAFNSPFMSAAMGSNAAAPPAVTAADTAAAAAAAAAGTASVPFGSVQQVMLDTDNTPQAAAATASAATAPGATAVGLGGAAGANVSLLSGMGSSGFMTLEQLQQLQISSIAGPFTLTEAAAAPGDSAAAAAAAAAASGLLLQQQQRGGLDAWMNPSSPAAAAAAAAAAAVAAAAAGGGGFHGGEPSWQQQQVLSNGRVKTETKTKYADGRFKDELRHQQRLSDMRERCNALFDGTIRGHFQVEHHKKVVCLVCNSVVVPYEAYHIDAVRKHFVRHHEVWLQQAGCNVDIWRKSCAPISKALSAAAAAAGGGGGAAAAAGRASRAAQAAAVAAVAAEDGSSAEAAAAAAGGDDEAVEGEEGARSVGRQSGTRLPDGRYKDPAQHQQRMVEMSARCAALFNGCVSHHWSIVSHKSITCHLCRSSITPYAAYHPDCLRKHFVRRHEDVLVAAGVDVAAWSKGIPLGRRKMKALLAQQQQQQLMLVQQQQQQQEAFMHNLQQQQQQQQQGGSVPVEALSLLSPAQLNPHLTSQLNSQQIALTTGGVDGAAAAAAAAVPASQQPLWSWLTAPLTQQQHQQGLGGVSAAIALADQQQQQHVFGSSAALLLPPAPHTGWQQQQQQQQQWGVGAGFNNPSAAAAATAPGLLPASQPLMAVVGFSDSSMAGFSGSNITQQQQLVGLGGGPGFHGGSSSSSQQPLPGQPVSFDPAASDGSDEGLGLSCCPMEGMDGSACQLDASLLHIQQQQQQQALLSKEAAASSGVAATLSGGAVAMDVNSHSAAAAAAPRVALGPGMLPIPQQQQQQQLMPLLPQMQLQQPGVMSHPHRLVGPVTSQGTPATANSASNTAAAAAAAAALPPLGPSGLLQQQQQQQQQQRGEGDGRSWVRELAAEWAASPSTTDLPPGFGPMSLSPAVGVAAEAGLGAAAANPASLSDAELAAVLAGEEDGTELDEILARHANWVLDLPVV